MSLECQPMFFECSMQLSEVRSTLDLSGSFLHSTSRIVTGRGCMIWRRAIAPDDWSVRGLRAEMRPVPPDPRKRGHLLPVDFKALSRLSRPSRLFFNSEIERGIYMRANTHRAHSHTYPVHSANCQRGREGRESREESGRNHQMGRSDSCEYRSCGQLPSSSGRRPRQILPSVSSCLSMCR